MTDPKDNAPPSTTQSEVNEDRSPDALPIGGEVTTFFGQPVLRGATHHCQSITPLVTAPSAPIRKRRTKGWWKVDSTSG